MELKTDVLDRVFEALGPVITAELERAGQEMRDNLEQEFRSRMEDLKQDLRREITAECERRFAEQLEAASFQIRSEAAAERARLESELAQGKEEWDAERARLGQDAERWQTYAEAQQQLAESSSQPEMLSRFLGLAHPFAGALALYVSGRDGLGLWKSKGDGAFPPSVSEETRNREWYFRYITVRGSTVAAVYASPVCQSEVLDFLGGSLERAVEAFGLKLRAPVPRAAASSQG